MPGRMITPIQIIDKQIQERIEAACLVIVNTLCYVGERCITEARDNGSYQDQTGNLRSSIGYAVVWDGKVVQMDHVDKVIVKKDGKVTSEGKDGVTEGQDYLSSRIKKARKKGIVLIVTAGMNYAEYVEAKGYNVLSSAELKAEPLIKSLLTRLGFNFK